MVFILQFTIPPPPARRIFIVSFENMCNFLTSSLKDKEKTGEIVSQLSHLANSYYSYYKPPFSTLKKQSMLKMLRNNREILILRADKNNGVVLMNRINLWYGQYY